MRWSRSILIGILTITVAGCSATPVRRSFKESMHDAVIKTAVRYKLTKDKEVKARHMNIDVWRGVVTLHGRALSAAERARAEELARGVKHVVAVENELKLVGERTAPVAKTTVQPPMQAANAEMKPAMASPPAVAPTMKSATPIVTAKSAGPVANRAITPPKAPVAKPAAPIVTTTQIPMAAPKIVKQATVVQETRPVVKKSAPRVASAAPMSPSKPMHVGKTLPWLGEVVDEEAPTVKPVKEIAERGNAPTISADEDLAREAAEELKRLRGNSGN